MFLQVAIAEGIGSSTLKYSDHRDMPLSTSLLLNETWAISSLSREQLPGLQVHCGTAAPVRRSTPGRLAQRGDLGAIARGGSSSSSSSGAWRGVGGGVGDRTRRGRMRWLRVPDSSLRLRNLLASAPRPHPLSRDAARRGPLLQGSTGRDRGFAGRLYPPECLHQDGDGGRPASVHAIREQPRRGLSQSGSGERGGTRINRTRARFGESKN